jgi:hypothetical protein
MFEQGDAKTKIAPPVITENLSTATLTHNEKNPTIPGKMFTGKNDYTSCVLIP